MLVIGIQPAIARDRAGSTTSPTWSLPTLPSSARLAGQSVPTTAAQIAAVTTSTTITSPISSSTTRAVTAPITTSSTAQTPTVASSSTSQPSGGQAEGRADELVSATPAGTPGNGNSQNAWISADGNIVWFASAASDLDSVSRGGQQGVFVRDMAARSTRGVIVEGTPAYDIVAVSSNGRFAIVLAFTDHAGRPYLYDRITSRFVRLNANTSRPFAVSDDGNTVVANNTRVLNLSTGAITNIVCADGHQPHSVIWASLSTDGKTVRFVATCDVQYGPYQLTIGQTSSTDLYRPDCYWNGGDICVQNIVSSRNFQHWAAAKANGPNEANVILVDRRQFQLSGHSRNAGVCGISEDGEDVTFVAADDGLGPTAPADVFILRSSTGVISKLPRTIPDGSAGCWAGAVSPAGAVVYSAGSPVQQVWRTDGQGGGPPEPPSPVSLSATPARQPVGDRVSLKASLMNLSTGAPVPNVLITFGVTAGPDRGFAAIIRTDAAGIARTTLKGKAAGVDSVQAWVDANINGKRESDEPYATVIVTWTPRTVYVALGDSYSSGEGTGNYDSDGLACHRGSAAWPRLLETDSTLLTTIQHKACTGALLQHMRGSWPSKSQPAQIPTTPQPDVGLVTVTIGGNNLGFASLLTLCAVTLPTWLPFTSSLDCAPFARRIAASALPGYQAALSRDIYPALERAYPNARIVHIGYPRITPPVGAPVNHFQCPWLSGQEQTALDQFATQIDNAIEAAASASKRVEHVSVLDALADHELCRGEPWIVPLIFETGIDPTNTEQGHPKFEGQEAIELKVAAKLGLVVTR